MDITQGLIASSVGGIDKDDPLATRLWQDLLLRQGCAAIALLEQAGIPAVVLKGAAGCYAGWWRARDRPITDVDLLVKPDDLTAAVEALRLAGWTPLFEVPRAVDAHRHSGAVQSPHGFLVDLHWFALRHCRWPEVDELLWENSRTVTWQNHTVRIPAREDFLVHTIAHGLRLDSDTMIWQQDLLKLVAPPARIDPARLARAAVHYRVQPLVRRALQRTVPNRAGALLPDRLLHAQPLPWRDRLFLLLTVYRRQKPGPLQALIVYLDYLRLTAQTQRPGGFSQYLCDRWQRKSAGELPSALASFLGDWILRRNPVSRGAQGR